MSKGPAGALSGAVVGAALGALGGALYGLIDPDNEVFELDHGPSVAREELVSVLAGSSSYKLELNCSPSEFSMRLSGKTFPRLTGNKSQLELRDHNGKDASSYITPAQRGLLRYVALYCQSSDGAKKIKTEIQMHAWRALEAGDGDAAFNKMQQLKTESDTVR